MTITKSLFRIALASLLLFGGTGCFERFSRHTEKDAAAPDAVSESTVPAPSGSEAPTSAMPPETKEAADKASAPESGGDTSDEVKLVQFTPEQLKAHGVNVVAARPGKLEQSLTLPGEVAVNADTVGHVLPRLPGTIQGLTKNIGDYVKRGELLAVIDSRELAEAKSAYLTAVEQVKVAQVNLEREKLLYDKGVSAGEDYIAAQNALKQAQIAQRAAGQSLSALGVFAKQLGVLNASPNALLTRYEVFAPTSGRVLEKHVSIGEVVSTETELYLIADLSTVWVNLSVGQKDLTSVHDGQPVAIRFNPGAAAGSQPSAAPNEPTGIPDVRARIKYIDALVAQDTRTATARVVLTNPSGHWRPGMFVSGLLTMGTVQAGVLVPLTAVIPYEGNPTVFVDTGKGFEARTVTLGRQSATQAEILSGLKVGEKFASDGAFMVKADLGKSEVSGE